MKPLLVIVTSLALVVMQGCKPPAEDATPPRPAEHATPPHDAPAGMAWIPGGSFTMGSELPGSRKNEQPTLKVKIDAFWLDVHDVTNAEFRKFVEATKYQTTAERPVDWEEIKKQVAPGTPKPPDEYLQPGSMVFTPTD
ncbi:MAG: sulfatase modifying factor 1, partial [Verrucomicrobiales bacterium]